MSDEKTPDASSLYEDSLPITSSQALAMLDEMRIKYELHLHQPLRTVEDSKALRGKISGAHIKNLYLRDGKKKNYLVVAEENKNIDLKTLAQDIGAGRLSFGSPERLMQFLGVRPGAVSPLALINDKDNHVRLIIDKNLLEASTINIHPLVNDKTITITTRDLQKIIIKTNHEQNKMIL